MNYIKMPYEIIKVPLSSRYKIILPLKTFFGFQYLRQELHTPYITDRIEIKEMENLIDKIEKEINFDKMYGSIKREFIFGIIIKIICLIASVYVLFIKDLTIGLAIGLWLLVIVFYVIMHILASVFTFIKKKIDNFGQFKAKVH